MLRRGVVWGAAALTAHRFPRCPAAAAGIAWRVRELGARRAVAGGQVPTHDDDDDGDLFGPSLTPPRVAAGSVGLDSDDDDLITAPLVPLASPEDLGLLQPAGGRSGAASLLAATLGAAAAAPKALRAPRQSNASGGAVKCDNLDLKAAEEEEEEEEVGGYDVVVEEKEGEDDCGGAMRLDLGNGGDEDSDAALDAGGEGIADDDGGDAGAFDVELEGETLVADRLFAARTAKVEAPATRGAAGSSGSGSGSADGGRGADVLALEEELVGGALEDDATRLRGISQGARKSRPTHR